MMVGYYKLNQMISSIIEAVAGVVSLGESINTASSTCYVILILQMCTTHTQFLLGKIKALFIHLGRLSSCSPKAVNAFLRTLSGLVNSLS